MGCPRITADEFFGGPDLHALLFGGLTERTRAPAQRQAQPKKRHVRTLDNIVSTEDIDSTLYIEVEGAPRFLGQRVDLWVVQQCGAEINERRGQPKTIVLGDPAQLRCPPGRRNCEANPERRGECFRKRRDIPPAFRCQHPVGRRPVDTHPVTIVLNNLQVIAARHSGKRIPAGQRREDPCRIMHFGRSTENLGVMRTCSLFQCLGDHTFSVHRDRHHICPQQLRRAPEAGIRQFFDQNGRFPPLQNGLENQRKTILPAV